MTGEVRDILQQFSWFRTLDPTFAGQLCRRASLAVLPAGGFFYQTGGLCDHVAFVGSGSIRVFKISEGGREITLYHVGPRESCLVNMLHTFLGSPVAASARAETPVAAALLPADVFRTALSEARPLLDHVLRTVSLRVHEFVGLIEGMAFHSLRRRLASFLVTKVGQCDRRTVCATHENIASEIGSVREVVSRVLKDFERQGMLTMGRGEVRIVNEEKLGTVGREDALP